PLLDFPDGRLLGGLEVDPEKSLRVGQGFFPAIERPVLVQLPGTVEVHDLDAGMLGRLVHQCLGRGRGLGGGRIHGASFRSGLPPPVARGRARWARIVSSKRSTVMGSPGWSGTVRRMGEANERNRAAIGDSMGEGFTRRIRFAPTATPSASKEPSPRSRAER